jgi:hypothetical protein
MSKTYDTMKTNVGNNIQDTSDAFKAISGVYLNNRYFDILRRINWKAQNPNYLFTIPVGATLVSMPSDFGKEIYVYDETNGQELDHISQEDLITTYADDMDDSGDMELYTMIDASVNGQRIKYLRPYHYPSSAISVRMPYQISPTALSTTTDLPIIACEDAMELGATADAWRYKRQFTKAADYEMLYEKSISILIWDKINQVNELTMFNPKPYDRGGLY